MQIDILLVAAVIPIFALGYYIYKKDVNREPLDVLFTLFAFGFLSALPVIILELILDLFFPTEGVEQFLIIFINTFIAVAFIEEGFKWIVTRFLGYNNKEFDEVYDIIVYAVFASLGFACIENIYYVYFNGFLTAILRALFSIPGHVCFGVIMGYYFAKAKLAVIQHQKNVKLFFLLSFLIPVVVHTIYDALISYVEFGGYWFLALFFVFYLIMFLLCFKIIDTISSEQKKIYQTMPIKKVVLSENHFCRHCGKKIEDSIYCPYCGKKVGE